MPQTPLTKTHFDQVLRKLLATMATRDDVKELKNELRELGNDFQSLQESVDRHLKTSSAQGQEFTVLKARFDRLRELLVKKGIATEEELSLIGS